MKITCNHCGAANELGRMFCMACGKRMTITNTDVHQAAAKARTFRPLAVVGGVFKWLIPSLLLIVLVVALIPDKAATEAGSDAVRVRAETSVKRLEYAADFGNRVQVPFGAAELNVLLAKRNDGLSCRIEGGRLIVIQRFTPFSGAKTFRLSRRLECEAVGGQLKVVRVWFGRLPLPGALSRAVTAPIEEALAWTDAEKRLIGLIRDYKIRDGKLEISMAP